MTKSIRWRVIVLQAVMVLVLGFAAGGALYASTFINTQVHDQLAPQQIFFPANAKAGLPADLSAYAGQQVLNGTQANAYAEHFIGLHLQEIGQGHPYSYWSGKAMTETNPTVKAQDQAIADTLFKGDTLQSMLNTAWTFYTIGQIAFIAFWVLLVAGLVVLGTLVFEVAELVRGKETVETLIVRAPAAVTFSETVVTAEPAAVN